MSVLGPGTIGISIPSPTQVIVIERLAARLSTPMVLSVALGDASLAVTLAADALTNDVVDVLEVDLSSTALEAELQMCEAIAWPS